MVDACRIKKELHKLHSVIITLATRSTMLMRLGDRLSFLPAFLHMTPFSSLLKNSFTLPKLLYNLRIVSCFLSPVLQEYDELLKLTLSGITNPHFGEDDPTWTQAMLPVKMGRAWYPE